MDYSEKSIARTLIYSDIFDYPLSYDEIWKYLIADKSVDKQDFDNRIKRINTIVYRNKEFFYIRGKETAISKRLSRYKESLRKIKLAKETIGKLFLIPTVAFIGISGNLAVLNANHSDDIDLFVIARKDTAWTTRLLLVLYLKILGKHRKRGDRDFSNKICLNMIIDEDNLSIPEKFRNLYTAHEVAQVKPLMERGAVYKKFANANKWIVKYMPNSLSEMRKQRTEKANKAIANRLFMPILTLSFFESLARFVQKIIMKKNLTREVTDNGFIALHPKDYKGIILSNYSKKISQYGLQI